MERKIDLNIIKNSRCETRDCKNEDYYKNCYDINTIEDINVKIRYSK